MKLRSYQTAAVESAIRTSQHARALVVIPTGGGKTVVMMEIVRQMATFKPALLLVHTDEIALQAERTLRAAGCRVQVEKAERRAHIAQSDLFGSHGGPLVIVGSVPTLQGRRLHRWRPDQWSVVLVDEAHHAPAPSWSAVLEHFADCPQIGVTATAQRKGLATMFELAYSMGLVEAVDEGWLVPPRFRVVVNRRWDLSKLRMVGPDVSDRQLEEALGDGAFADAMALVRNELGATGAGLLFAPSRGVSRRSAEWLNAAAIPTVYLEGRTPTETRRGAVTRFRRGALRVLSNCAVLTEGFDCPDASHVLLLRPTRLVGAYLQRIGRGLRPLPGIVDRYERAEDRRAAIAESGKPECRILDIQGSATKLAEKLVSPILLVSAEIGEPQEIVRGGELELDGATLDDLREVIAERKAESEREEELARLAARQRALAQARAPQVRDAEILSGRNRPATDKQIAFIRRLCRQCHMPPDRQREYEHKARNEWTVGQAGGVIRGLKRKAGWR